MRAFSAAFSFCICSCVLRSCACGVSRATSRTHSCFILAAFAAVSLSIARLSATWWHSTARRVMSKFSRSCLLVMLSPAYCLSAFAACVFVKHLSYPCQSLWRSAWPMLSNRAHTLARLSQIVFLCRTFLLAHRTCGTYSLDRLRSLSKIKFVERRDSRPINRSIHRFEKFQRKIRSCVPSYLPHSGLLLHRDWSLAERWSTGAGT